MATMCSAALAAASGPASRPAAVGGWVSALGQAAHSDGERSTPRLSPLVGPSSAQSVSARRVDYDHTPAVLLGEFAMPPPSVL